MDLPLNYNRPLIMHVDLNSCFAMIEQQANPLIRHKPVAVAAYDTPRGAVIASSYEAKALGIKLGVNVREARMLCRDVIVMMPDPDKYFDAHRRFKQVLLNYTDTVTPKSVDEFVIDFTGSLAVQRGKRLEDVGREIKAAVKEALGEYVTVNIGIGPNRFLAKVAAGLHKPDDLDVITGETVRDVYATLNLIDLPGINTRFKAWLNIAGIHTPLQFLGAPLPLLKKQLFKSITGYYWYLRLRGHEIDGVDFGRKSYGQQYALGDKTTDRAKLSRLLMKLSEKTGRRLRGDGYLGEGIYLWLSFEDRTYWAKGRDTKTDIYATQDIYLHAQRLLNQAPVPARVTNMGVTVYKLKRSSPEQLGLFDGTWLDTKSLARAADSVNNRFGEFTLVPATMANMQDVILRRVAFGSVRDLWSEFRCAIDTSTQQLRGSLARQQHLCHNIPWHQTSWQATGECWGTSHVAASPGVAGTATAGFDPPHRHSPHPPQQRTRRGERSVHYPLGIPVGSRPAAPRRRRGRRRGDNTVVDEAERNARLEAYTRQARESVCRIAEDGRTEVGLEVEHDGRWFRTVDHIPGEDVSDEAIEPVVARRARQIARQMVARDEARRPRKPSG